ncbi:hypothetical protein [Streptomyces sp. NPDC096068]
MTGPGAAWTCWAAAASVRSLYGSDGLVTVNKAASAALRAIAQITALRNG